jgi:hypothetical protein
MCVNATYMHATESHWTQQKQKWRIGGKACQILLFLQLCQGATFYIQTILHLTGLHQRRAEKSRTHKAGRADQGLRRLGVSDK